MKAENQWLLDAVEQTKLAVQNDNLQDAGQWLAITQIRLEQAKRRDHQAMREQPNVTGAA